MRGTANSGIVSSSPLIDAGYQRTTGGHITLNSGVILQNNECSDAGDGGAVTIGEDGTLVINGAVIRNNAKEDGNAGAIKAYAGAEITLNSGEIYGNSAYKHGGAIQIFGGDSTDNVDAVLTMNGGTIRNNKAAGVGGGIAVSNYSQFIMNGGSIIDNATTDSQKRGGGVGFADADTAMSVSGNAVISGNAANNLYIGTNSCNILTVGAMGSAADIGVTMKNSSGGVFTDGGAAYVERFYSDDSDFSVTVDGENLKLSHIHSYTYTANNNVITETCTCGHSETATITAPGGTIVYDGSEKDGATVSYSNGWIGGSLTVTYVNNIHAGQATASITKAGAIASVKFTINKAEPDYTLPMGVTATYGETLANISISNWGSGWSWKDPDQSVGNAGMHSFKAVFTPNDIDNYSEIEVDVTVTVRKASLIVTANDKAIIYGDAPSNDGVRYTGFVGNENPDVLGGTLTYSYTYSRYGDVGTYDITVGGLTSDNYEITYVKGNLTVAQKEIGISWGSTSLTYNGTAQKPAATAIGTVNGDSLTLSVGGEQTDASNSAYTATVTGISGTKAGNYKLPADRSTTFVIEQQALTIVWGNSSFAYDGTEKFPAFNVDGIWNDDDVEVTHSSAQVNASDTAYTATITGLTGSDAANYKLTGTLTKEFTIAKADQIAPTGLTKADTTYFGKADGKIFGLTSAMEFRKEGDSSYTAGFNGTLGYLAAGTYYIRYQGDANHNPSPDAVVTVNAGRKLQIVVPQNQVGYTVTVNKTEMEYEGSYTLKVEINEGYTATEDFKIIISSWACGQQAGVEATYMNAIADQIIEVQGVADITAPTAKIEVAENGWTTFLNTITFGQFFKEKQDVTISATDLGSGVNSIEYYIANGEMTLDAVKAITAWEGYNGTFRINPDNQYVIYAKVTDNAGNITYISSDGLVLDATAPALFGIENNGVYYGDKIFKAIDDHFLKIKIDGIDVTDTTQGDDEYKVTADNTEHTVTVTDKAGNVTEYKITVYKNYTVTFKVDGATVDTQTVGYGKDANLLSVPAKDGYVGKWDSDGKNIIGDTTITAVYTAIPVVKPDDVKPEDKAGLEDTKKQLEDMLDDDSYTDDDKKDIQDAIDDIDDALEVIENVEAVEELIDKLPDTSKKDDEPAIKAADDSYNALTDYEKSLVDEDAKKALADAKAALAGLNKPADTDSPQTGDNSHMFLWIALLFISGGAVITLTVVDRKRRMASNR